MMLSIVVVEDEAHVLNGIAKLITRLSAQYRIIGEACNGAQGLEMIERLGPDLVISDIKMPDMDGLTMLRSLRDAGVHSQFIILTGYADFSFVREALKLGSVDYLLKPTNVGELKKAIEQAEARIRSGGQNILLSEYSQQQLLSQIVLGGSEQNAPFLESLRLRIGPGPYVCLLLHSDHTIPASQKQSLHTATSQHFPDAQHQVVTVYLDGTDEILTVAASSSANDDLIIRMRRVWTSYCDAGDVAGCAERLSDLCHLNDLLNAMRDTLQWAISFPPCTLLSAELIRTTHFADLVYPSQIEASLLGKIKSGKLSESRVDFERLNKYLSSERYPYTQLRETMLSLASSLLFVIRRLSYSIYTELNQMQIDEMSRRTNSVESYVNALMNGINQYDFSRRSLDHCDNAVVRNILRIVHAEYSQDISLDSIADRLNLTTEYLSTLFKKETGVNFTTYLTQYRIDRSKELLLQPNKRIYEIAELCGYRDTAYFCKVFKRVTGVSPKEYMKSIT